MQLSADDYLGGRRILYRYLEERHRPDGSTLFLIRLHRFAYLASAAGASDVLALLSQILTPLNDLVGDRGRVFQADSGYLGILLLSRCDQGQATQACIEILKRIQAVPICRHSGLEMTPTVGVATLGLGESIRDWTNNAFLAVASTDPLLCRYTIYRPELRDRLTREAAFRRQLALAVEQQSFTLHYQPRIHLETGRYYSVEALLRWPGEDGGMIAGPDRFIPLLENSELIIQVTDWVFRRAAHELRAWLNADPRNEFGFNVSAKVLLDGEFGEVVKHTVDLLGLNPKQIAMELTETAAWNNRPNSAPVLSDLRKFGLKLAIDDFGVGFSTLDYLRDMPADQIKIDRTFVRDLLTSPRDQFLVKTIVQIGREFGLEVVAEGAEDDDTVALLAQLGCDSVQGYALARPMPIDALLAWYRNRPS